VKAASTRQCNKAASTQSCLNATIRYVRCDGSTCVWAFPYDQFVCLVAIRKVIEAQSKNVLHIFVAHANPKSLLGQVRQGVFVMTWHALARLSKPISLMAQSTVTLPTLIDNDCRKNLRNSAINLLGYRFPFQLPSNSRRHCELSDWVLVSGSRQLSQACTQQFRHHSACARTVNHQGKVFPFVKYATKSLCKQQSAVDQGCVVRCYTTVRCSKAAVRVVACLSCALQYRQACSTLVFASLWCSRPFHSAAVMQLRTCNLAQCKRSVAGNQSVMHLGLASRSSALTQHRDPAPWPSTLTLHRDPVL
jgi:hypothetical protein